MTKRKESTRLRKIKPGIGLTLKIARLKAGLQQNELAKLLGTDPSVISKWEREESLPSTAMLIELREIFKCTIDSLLTPTE